MSKTLTARRKSDDFIVLQAEVGPNDLAGICLEVCGGGYNESQTADAMEMQAALNVPQPVTKHIKAVGEEVVFTLA